MAPGALGQHAGQGKFAQQERGAHVDCQTAVQEVNVQIDHGRFTVDAGVIHQNIDAPEACQGGVHQVADVVHLRHVALDA